MKHFPRAGTAPHLIAICDRYTAENIGDVGDERRDRFSTSEAVILDPATGCAYCRDLLIEATAHPVPPPQAWAHPDVVARSIAGELDDGPRPWPTWRAAIRSYVAWQDSGASLRSSSDPSRFEALPSGHSGPPGGDQGQRQAERLAWVGQALAGAFLDGFRVRVMTESVKLYPSECLQILVALVAGRDADQHTGWSGGKRKQVVRVRIPITDDPDVKPEERRSPHAIIACEVSERTGFPVTAGTVMAIERQGGLEIQEALSRRGLVLHRDDRLDEAEAAMAAVNKQRLLRGLRAMSEHTGWSVRRILNARGWTPPIPIRREGEEWVADADEVDAWRLAGPVAPGGEDAA